MIYLDNMADTVQRFFCEEIYYNPNSPYELGVKAREVLEGARQSIKNSLNTTTGKIIFGGTASFFAKFLIDKFGDYLFKWSVYEHDCINQLLETKETPSHYSFEYVFLQKINNLNGTVFDWSSYVNEHKDYLIFMDGTAAIGREYIHNLDQECDAFFFSGHKINGPKSVGAMWISDRLAERLNCTESPTNEYGLLHGTPNVGDYVALAKAVKYVNDEKRIEIFKTYSEIMQKSFFNKLEENEIAFYIKETKSKCKVDTNDSIIALTLPGIDSNALVQYLSSKEIYVNIFSSACDSQTNEQKYRVPRALDYSDEETDNTIRISLWHDTNFIWTDHLTQEIANFKMTYC